MCVASMLRRGICIQISICINDQEFSNGIVSAPICRKNLFELSQGKAKCRNSEHVVNIKEGSRATARCILWQKQRRSTWTCTCWVVHFLCKSVSIHTMGSLLHWKRFYLFWKTVGLSAVLQLLCIPLFKLLSFLGAWFIFIIIRSYRMYMHFNYPQVTNAL